MVEGETMVQGVTWVGILVEAVVHVGQEMKGAHFHVQGRAHHPMWLRPGQEQSVQTLMYQDTLGEGQVGTLGSIPCTHILGEAWDQLALQVLVPVHYPH